MSRPFVPSSTTGRDGPPCSPVEQRSPDVGARHSPSDLPQVGEVDLRPAPPVQPRNHPSPPLRTAATDARSTGDHEVAVLGCIGVARVDPGPVHHQDVVDGLDVDRQALCLSGVAGDPHPIPIGVSQRDL